MKLKRLSRPGQKQYHILVLLLALAYPGSIYAQTGESETLEGSPKTGSELSPKAGDEAPPLPASFPLVELEGSLSLGADSFEGFKFRIETMADYRGASFFTLRTGLATEFSSLIPDEYFLESLFRIGEESRLEFATTFILNRSPYTGYMNLTLKNYLSLLFPYFEFRVGIGLSSYPDGSSGTDFLMLLGFRLSFDEDRLGIAFRLSDFGDFMRGSIATILYQLEVRYKFEGFEAFVDLKAFAAGTLALSATWSRVVFGVGLRRSF